MIYDFSQKLDIGFIDFSNFSQCKKMNELGTFVKVTHVSMLVLL